LEYNNFSYESTNIRPRLYDWFGESFSEKEIHLDTFRRYTHRYR
jgi:hypothetical protein